MPRRFAITVGVNRYDFLPYQELRYAERDAVRMRDLLTERLGFEKVLFFGDPLDGSGKREALPTLANLLTALDRVAKKVRLQPEDSFWFFFSGHGAREGGYDYLLPSDGNPDLLQRTAISTDSVMRGLRECGAGQVVMILDACRNVLGGGKSVGGVGRDTENLARQQGIISLFSCAPEQISWELEQLEQGAFTQALLEKLGEGRGLAGLTVQGLDEFLRERVPELNRLYGKQVQNPYAIAEPSWRYLQPVLLGIHETELEPETVSASTSSSSYDPIYSGDGCGTVLGGILGVLMALGTILGGNQGIRTYNPQLVRTPNSQLEGQAHDQFLKAMQYKDFTNAEIHLQELQKYAVDACIASLAAESLQVMRDPNVDNLQQDIAELFQSAQAAGCRLERTAQ